MFHDETHINVRSKLMHPGCWCFTVYQRQDMTQYAPVMAQNLPSYTGLGGLEHEFYDFPFSWECHGMSSSQLTHIFQRGGSTTNQYSSYKLQEIIL